MIARITLGYQQFNKKLAKKIAYLIMNPENGQDLFPLANRQINENYSNDPTWPNILDGTALESIKFFQQAITILLYELRTEHHYIVAGSGIGKTQCFQQMILNDLEQQDVSIV